MTAPAVADPQPQATKPAGAAAPMTTPRGRDCRGDVVELVERARAGDDSAWEALHDRFMPLLRGIARRHRLSSSDVDDVMQAVWLLLLCHIGRLRDPAALAGWLATTCRRECLRVSRLPARECPTDDPALGDDAEIPDLDAGLLAAERRLTLHRALDTLPVKHRRLMVLLVSEPVMDYRQISATLSMPRGSIGPIRSRSLARLERHPELHRLRASGS